jgi:hypothetical protein
VSLEPRIEGNKTTVKNCANEWSETKTQRDK